VAENFEATYQKVGTFRVVNGNKQGGNVASYFCLSDGTVIHAVAGPLDAAQYLQELRWAIDLRKQAASESGGDLMKYRRVLRFGHQERLSESGPRIPADLLPAITPGAPPIPTANPLHTPVGRRLAKTRQGQVHTLLAYYPLPKIQQLYPIVFEEVLKEKVSTLPVATK
jgi:hypothetical protein